MDHTLLQNKLQGAWEGISSPRLSPEELSVHRKMGIMKRQAISVFSVLCVLCWVESSWAVNRMVPRDHPTITEALAAARSGDTIWINGGTYSQSSGETFPLVLKSGVNLTGAGMHCTIVDASGSGQSVVALSGAVVTVSPVISELQLRGGGAAGADGGAISLSGNSGSPVTVQKCLVQFNTADRGGAAWVDSARLRIEHSELRGNSALLLGGCVAAWGWGSHVEIVSSTLTQNTCETGTGGAVYVGSGNNVTIQGSTLSANQAQIGGALAVEGTLVMHRNPENGLSVVRENIASIRGGGLWAFPGASVSIEQTDFSSNQADAGAAWGAQNATLAIHRSRFFYHTAETSVFEARNSSLTLCNLIVARNDIPEGDVFYLADSSGYVAHCTFVYNSPKDTINNGTLVIQGAPNLPAAPLRILNSLIAYNSGVGVVERTVNSDPEFRNNLLYENSLGFYLDENFFLYKLGWHLNLLLNNAPQAVGGNHSGSPAFRGPEIDDFRLLATSAARDRGTVIAALPGASVDFEGQSRLGIAAGAAPDSGADEITHPRVIGSAMLYSGVDDPPRMGDALVLQFDRPIRLTAPLTTNDFFLPVTSDTLGTTSAITISESNPTQLVIHLGLLAVLTWDGIYQPGHHAPSSPSGIDLRAGTGTLKVVDRELGIVSIPMGNNPSANTLAADINRTAGPWRSTWMLMGGGGVLEVHPSSLLPRTRLMVPANALIYDFEIRVRSPQLHRASSSAVQFDIITGSPVMKYGYLPELTLHYDPAEFAAWGYEEKDLRIHRLTEVARDVYHFLPLTQSEGYTQTQDFVNHTLTVPIREIIPPRPVFRRLSGETSVGPYSALYAVLPVSLIPDTVHIEPATSGADPVAAVNPRGPDELSLSGAELPDHRPATGTGGTLLTVRSLDALRELTGASPRPWVRRPSSQLAFEAFDAITQERVDSFSGPAHVTIQFSDGLGGKLPSDLWDWNGEPVWPSQMRIYRFSPASRNWEIFSPEHTIANPGNRTLTAVGVSPLIESGGVGLFTAVGDPTAPYTQSFSTSSWGWGSGNATPSLPAAITRYSNRGMLEIQANGPEGYAYWGAPPASYIPRRNQMYLATFELYGALPANITPGVRLRVTSGDTHRSTENSVFGSGTGQAAPANGTPRFYHLLFEPSGRSLDAAYAGDTRIGSFTPFFEMAHFRAHESNTATIGLRSLRIAPFDPESLGPWTTALEYDFKAAGEDLGWTIFGPIEDIATYSLAATPEGLALGGSMPNRYAGIGIDTGMFIQSGRLYRARYRLFADTEAHRVPSFRLRVGDTQFETAYCLSVTSNGNGEESPGFKAREYDVYYYPPQAMVSLPQCEMSLAFDYINFNPADNYHARFYIEWVRVDSTPWTP